MTVMTVSASTVAHAVHYAVLAIGLLGLVALLGPHWLGANRPHPPRDEHEQRVAALHQQLASGSFSTATRTMPSPTVAKRLGGGAALTIAVISSAAAAAVHAAVGPEHFDESLLFGLFFATAATAQLIWALWMTLAPTRTLLLIGAVGNAGVLVLWLVTRTVGLPFGLLPKPEGVGAWDLCCVVWEIVVVAASAQALRTKRAEGLEVPRYGSWNTPTRAWMFGSALALVALSLSGASS